MQGELMLTQAERREPATRAACQQHEPETQGQAKRREAKQSAEQ